MKFFLPQGFKWQPTPVFLPGKSLVQRSLLGCSPQGRKKSDTIERLTHTHTHTHALNTTYCWQTSDFIRFHSALLHNYVYRKWHTDTRGLSWVHRQEDFQTETVRDTEICLALLRAKLESPYLALHLPHLPVFPLKSMSDQDPIH